jgi:hypothetical protein
MRPKVDGVFHSSIVAILLITGCGGGDHVKEPAGQASAPAEQKGGGGDSPPYEVVELSSVGAVRGTVRLVGDAPKLSPITVSKDEDVCGPRMPDISLQLGTGAAVEGAVVSLVGVSRGKAVRPLNGPAELELIKCNAVPRVQIVPVGTILEIVNSDPILHDLYGSIGPREDLFHVALPVQLFRARVNLDRAGLVHVTCGAGHPWMSAHIVVHEHPYAALTNARGTYAISDIPPGSHVLRVWHELLGQMESPVTIEAGTTATLDFELKYAVEASEPSRQ